MAFQKPDGYHRRTGESRYRRVFDPGFGRTTSGANQSIRKAFPIRTR
jgi:hypothetical protein